MERERDVMFVRRLRRDIRFGEVEVIVRRQGYRGAAGNPHRTKSDG